MHHRRVSGPATAPAYRRAGVDLDRHRRLLAALEPLARRTYGRRVVTGIGGFAAVLAVPGGGARPLLAVSADGVGTKLAVAAALSRHDTVGRDLVAMVMNDIVTVGATPLALLDYYAASRLEPENALAVLRGVLAGCAEADCALVGGETAQMPGTYARGAYDLVGFGIGLVDRSRLIDGRAVRPGDRLVGLASTGLHSNGFSLVRRILARTRTDLRATVPALGRPLGDVLLTPTRIYVRPVLAVARRHRLRAIAHITGGGLAGNVARILPAGCQARIRRGAWLVPAIYAFLQDVGHLVARDMEATFNMGLGIVVVTAEDEAEAVRRAFQRHGVPAYHIGTVNRRPRAGSPVVYEGDR